MPPAQDEPKIPGSSRDHEPSGNGAVRVADALRGQCLHSLEDVLADLQIPDALGLREALDELVFECDQCGWWCEASEESASAPGVCDECSPGEA